MDNWRFFAKWIRDEGIEIPTEGSTGHALGAGSRRSNTNSDTDQPAGCSGRLPRLAGFRPGVGLALSPSDGRVAITLGNTTAGQLWVYDLARGSLSSLSAHAFALTRPVWAPKGQDVLFSSLHKELMWNLASRRSDAATEEERLAPSDGAFRTPVAVSPDGRWLVFEKDLAAAHRTLLQEATPCCCPPSA